MPAEQASLPLLDDGVLRGDAVFDVMMVRGGRTHAADRHLARLRASARVLGIRVPVVRGVVVDLLAAWGGHDGALRIVVTRGGALRGLLTATSHPDAISLSAIELDWGGPLTGVKSLSYAANVLATRRARANEADDALIVDARGQVLELPTAAVVALTGDEVVTPDPAALPILESITVGVLAEIADVDRRVLDLDEVRAADAVMVASATRPLLPVHALDDVAYDLDLPAAVELRERFSAHLDATLDPLP